MTKTSYADRLAWLRRVTGLGTRETARLAGLSETHVSRLEAVAPAAVTARSLYQVAGVFGVSLDWLYLGTGDAPIQGDVRAAVYRAKARS